MAKFKINHKNSNDDILNITGPQSIVNLLVFATEHNCSDLYIKVLEQPYVSRFGNIIRVPCTPISTDVWYTFYDAYILKELNAQYVTEKLLDTSVAIRIPESSPNYCKYPNNQYRYRVSFGFSEGKNVATFRMIKPDQPTFDTINFDPICINALTKAYSKPSGITYFTGPTGSGKALEQHTKIPTINGIKLLKDIKIGDTIFDKNGEQTKVIGKYHPNDEHFYEFTFSDGTKVKSAEGHLWEVEMLNVWKSMPSTYNKLFDSTVLYKLMANKDNHIIVDYQFLYRLVFNEKCSYKELKYFISTNFKDSIIDISSLEYLDINALIESTKMRKRSIDKVKALLKLKETKQYITNSEAKNILKSKYIEHIRNAGLLYMDNKYSYVYLDDICQKCIAYYNTLSDTVNNTGKNIKAILTTHDIVANGLKNNADRYNFAISRPKACQYDSIKLPIKPYSLGFLLGNKNKHIPEQYKKASIEDKLLLIAGLLDSIGNVNSEGCCSVALTIPSIIYDLREICCSLGFKCSKITPSIKQSNKKLYKFSFYPTIMLPLQIEYKKKYLQDKLNNHELQIKSKRFYLTNIQEIKGSNKNYYCLAVDSNTHTFLCTDSYLPTHNSTTMAACINTFTKPNGILDNKVFITLEDPIENLFSSTDSVKISQKELGKDFKTFELGIKASLREHPNIILVGECRDKEVICAAIEAARTGHNTITTFHAADVAGTINRLLYHLDNDKNLCLDLILQLNIILSQKMLKQNGKYLVDTQYMLFDDEITKILVTLLDNPDVNISTEINKIIVDPYFQQKGLVKDWSYRHLH